jgi:hypothetical protein
MELTKQQFIDRFTNQEFVSILSTTKTDIEVEAWLFRFNNLTGTIDTLDPRTLLGLGLLVTKNIITQSRLEEISGSVQQWNGWSIGQMVRVLTPFTATYPSTYMLIEIDPVASALTIEGGAQFDPQYLEAV